MTLEKAIEANEDTVKFLEHKGLIRKAKALKLGIEALEYAQRDRRGLSDVEIELLPGETED